MSVWQYVINRLLLTIPMLLVLLVIIFLVLRVMPGDPCLARLGGRNVDMARIDQCRVQHGFDQPIHVEFVHYLGDIVRGDFGDSLRTGRPVLQEIFRKFPATLELALFGIILAMIMGISSGILGATHSDRPLDHAMRVFNIGSFSIPIFWMGLILLMLLAVPLEFFPTGTRLSSNVALERWSGFHVIDSIVSGNWAALGDALRHLILPGLTLGLILSGFIGRMTRANMLEVLGQDYIRTARAKGLAERVVTNKHALRNALIPIATVIGLEFALLMSGAVLTETVFSWPGMARYLLVSIESRDFISIQGTIVFIAIFIMTINMLVDIAYSFLDPRVRY